MIYTLQNEHTHMSHTFSVSMEGKNDYENDTGDDVNNRKDNGTDTNVDDADNDD